VRFQLLLIACVSLVLFIGGALRQADLVNANLDAADQSSYIDYAKNLRTSHFQYIGDRNRMPVYPSLMALFYRPGMTDQEFFDVGKRVGIAVAIIVLVAAFLVFWRYVQFMEASTVALVAAFTVFAYKASLLPGGRALLRSGVCPLCSDDRAGPASAPCGRSGYGPCRWNCPPDESRRPPGLILSCSAFFSARPW
jgi:hypothetical protein